MKLAAAVAMFALAAPADAAEPKPTLDLPSFFTGRTHAENVLKIALKRPVKLVVDSVGYKERDGDFVLVDTVREEGKPVRARKWVMRPTGPNRFTGTLDDAVGRVEGVVAGDTATIRYTMKGGLKVVQVMQLQPRGRTLSNRVEVSKFGMKFARVEGTIRKLD